MNSRSCDGAPRTRGCVHQKSIGCESTSNRYRAGPSMGPRPARLNGREPDTTERSCMGTLSRTISAAHPSVQLTHQSEGASHPSPKPTVGVKRKPRVLFCLLHEAHHERERGVGDLTPAAVDDE